MASSRAAVGVAADLCVARSTGTLAALFCVAHYWGVVLAVGDLSRASRAIATPKARATEIWGSFVCRSSVAAPRSSTLCSAAGQCKSKGGANRSMFACVGALGRPFDCFIPTGCAVGFEFVPPPNH